MLLKRRPRAGRRHSLPMLPCSLAMTEIDRTSRLQELDVRHDALLEELEALSRDVESVLAAVRPPSAALVEMPALVNRAQQPQPKRRAQ